MRINQGDGGKVIFKCTFCPLKCKISVGGLGLCNSFFFENGTLFYNPSGRYYAFRNATMESVGFYHFWPGHEILTLHIGNIELRKDLMNFLVETGNILELLNKKNSGIKLVDTEIGVFISGFEPLHDFILLEGLVEFYRKRKALICMETSGFYSADNVEKIISKIDAIIFNFMGFDDASYRKILPIPRGFEHALQAFEYVFETVPHVEITYQAVNGINVNVDGFIKLVKKIIDIAGYNVPLHITRSNLSRFIYRRPSTNKEMEKLWREAKNEGMNFVYINGYYQSPKNHTICPENKRIVIEHLGHWIKVRWKNLLKECFKSLNIKGNIRENFPLSKNLKKG